jgi:large subunit ribosomal protein L10
MARSDKVAAVAELKTAFTDSAAAVLTEYRGLTVADLKELRRSLGDQASYAVAKNTLTKLAAQDAGIEGLDAQLTGPTAIAFISGDVATVAKSLRDFAKANPLLVIKGGVMDGRVLDADTVKKLADLESREVLLAKLAGAMKGSAQKAVSLFAAPLTQAAQLMGALQVKAQEDPSVIAGAGVAPAETPAESNQEQTDEAPAADVAETPAEASDEAPATNEDSADAASETNADEAASN